MFQCVFSGRARPVCPSWGMIRNVQASPTHPSRLDGFLYGGLPSSEFFYFFIFGLVSCFNNRSLCFANCYYIIFCVIRCLFCLACSCQFAMMLFFAIFVPSVAFSGLSPYSLSFSRIERLRTLYFGFCVLLTSCFL